MTPEEIRAEVVPPGDDCAAAGVPVTWDGRHSVGNSSPTTLVAVWNAPALDLTPFDGEEWLATAIGATTRIVLHYGPGGLGPLKVEDDPRCPLSPRYGRLPVVFQILGEGGNWNAVGVGEFVAHGWMAPHHFRFRVYYRLAVNLTPELRRTLESEWTGELGRDVVVDTVQVHLKDDRPVMVVSVQGHEVASGAPTSAGVWFTWSRKYGADGMILQ